MYHVPIKASKSFMVLFCDACFLINKHVAFCCHEEQNSVCMVYGYKPNILNLKNFGCLCYVHISKNKLAKLDPRTRNYIFLGYKIGTKGYFVLHVNTIEALIS